jgi:DNA helicase-2/ATP-dependent DNA helicase PcrA
LELYNVVKDYADRNNPATLQDFLEEVSLVSDSDQLPDTDLSASSEGAESNVFEVGDCVVLMTLHTAKGLEFPVVFLTGLEEGTFPHINSMESEAELEEERRLAYVGVTRAKEKLYLTNSMFRMMWGTAQRSSTSRFIGDIPSELIAEESRSNRYNLSRDEERYVEDELGFGFREFSRFGGSGKLAAAAALSRKHDFARSSYGVANYEKANGFKKKRESQESFINSFSGATKRKTPPLDESDGGLGAAGSGAEGLGVGGSGAASSSASGSGAEGSGASGAGVAPASGTVGSGTVDSSTAASGASGASGASAKQGAEIGELSAGDKIVHNQFGNGTVLSVQGEGKRAIAEIDFAVYGKKRLLLRLSPIRKC